MKITVTKDNVKIEEFDVVHEGEHRVNKCSFSFSEEFTEELVKKAIFTSQNSSIEVTIIDNECDIPTEILKARNIVLLGVYAYKVVDDKLDLRYSPSPDAFKVNSGSYIEVASESEEITPSQFEQYMQALNDGLNKVEESLKKMDEATSSATQLVDKIEQKLENGDFIGPEGSEGPQGVPGANGKDGVGITTITSGQSTVEDDKTVTPVTVQKTDGSSQIFNVEAKNGIDGQNGQNGKDGVNGQDGLTPSIGENGNWFIGDTDTGKPSRGKVGPSPDLSDYVKNTDYANASKAGVLKINGNAARISSDGVLSAAEVSEEQYKTTVNSIFISKGTLDNIKNFLVESSRPVQDLTSTVTNIQEEQDEGMPKQTTSGEMITVDDALAYKTFNVTVDGASEQETMTGKNLFDYNNVVSSSHGLNVSLNENGSITVVGNPDTNYIDIVPPTNYDRILEDGETYTISQDVPGYIYLQIGFVPKDGSTTVYATSSNSSSAKEFSFTVDKTKYTYTAEIQSGTMASLGNNVNFTAKFQLEKGSKATEFEKYTGGQPSPSPDYPQEITTLTFDKITRRGKNYLNIEDGSQTINGVTVTKNNGKITVNGTATNTCFFPISKSIDNFRPGKYVLSANNSKTLNNNQNLLRIMKEDNTGYLESTITNFSKINNTTIFNITADDDVNNTYLLLRIETGTVLDNFVFYPQLEQGSQATDYEPYQATEYAIDLQGNEMVELPNGVKDELVIDKYGNVSLIKNVGKVIFDGSEDWICTASKVYTLLADINLPWCDVADVPNFICDMFIPAANDSLYSRNNCIASYIPTPQYNYQKLTISKYDFNGDVDLFKSFLSTHNVIVYYQLENPQPIPLGTLSELITTLNGTNNISINGNIPTTISTTYALDIKKYIDNKLAEISTALIEEG